MDSMSLAKEFVRHRLEISQGSQIAYENALSLRNANNYANFIWSTPHIIESSTSCYAWCLYIRSSHSIVDQANYSRILNA